MKRQALMAMVAAAAMTVTLGAGGQKGGGTKGTFVEYPAEITFWDRGPDAASGFSGDAVMGDGRAYKNGVDGLKVVFQDNADGTCCRQFLLKVPGRNRGRYLRFDYRNQVPTACDAQPDGPVGTMTGGADFWVTNILSMPVGSTIAKQGTFSTPLGMFAWRDPLYHTGNAQQPYYCSQFLVVTRSSQSEWTVTTDVDPNIYYYPTYGGDPVTPGSIAQLDQNAELRGNYRMSFGATIKCPTCPLPQ